MLRGFLVGTFVLLLSTSATAQSSAVFDDVPPWHWAYDAVQTVGAAGIFIGYPATPSETALEAITQVYDTFAHATHPGAREWAERFLINTPVGWPEPLTRSRLQNFRLENTRVNLTGERGMATFVTITFVRMDNATIENRNSMRVDLQRDANGHWRVDYASLAAGQPQIFR